MTPRDPSPARATGLLTIVLTLAGWSSVPLFLRHFAPAMDAWTSNGWRYGFAALIWAPVVVLGMRRGTVPPALWRAALVPSVFNSAGQVLFTWAHYRISPGLLTFGLRTQILFVALGAFLLFPAERRVVRTVRFWLGVLLVLGGTFGTIWLGSAPPRDAEVAGIAMAVGAGILFAAYALGVRASMGGFPSLQAFAVVSQITAAAMVVLMLVFGVEHGATVLRLPGSEFALLLLSALIGIALGHVLYFISIKRLGVAAAAGVLQVQPVIVAAASFFLFGEVLTAPQWASGAVAIAGAVTILVVEARAREGDTAARKTEPAG